MNGEVLIIPGCPVPCGRPRSTLQGHVYMPERTRKYERMVRRLASAVFQAPYEGPVELRATFMLPDRRRRDLDNLVKSVMDGLNGVAFLDDSQVVVNASMKFVDNNCCAVVCVKSLESACDIWETVKAVCETHDND